MVNTYILDKDVWTVRIYFQTHWLVRFSVQPFVKKCTKLFQGNVNIVQMLLAMQLQMLEIVHRYVVMEFYWSINVMMETMMMVTDVHQIA